MSVFVLYCELPARGRMEGRERKKKKKGAKRKRMGFGSRGLFLSLLSGRRFSLPRNRK